MAGWVVTLNPEDLDAIRAVTVARYTTKARHGVRTQKYDPSRSDESIMRTGFMGEVAFCRAMLVDPNWDVLIGGDDGHDVYAYRKSWQVKTPHGEVTKDWFYVNSVDKFISDYGVLCNVINSKTVVIRAVIDNGSFLRTCQEKNWGFGRRLGVSASQMYPVSRMIEAIQEQGGTTIGEPTNAY